MLETMLVVTAMYTGAGCLALFVFGDIAEDFVAGALGRRPPLSMRAMLVLRHGERAVRRFEALLLTPFPLHFDLYLRAVVHRTKAGG
jgi:hypothetical protein